MIGGMQHEQIIWRENSASHGSIDDDLINKTIDLIGKDYARQNEDREEDKDYSPDRALENIIDYEYSMDGKLLVSLIIGREIAKRIGGIAVAYYE